MKINEKTVRAIIRKSNREKSNLLAILNDIQTEYNWLPPQALKIVAEELGIHLIDVYGVASFYHAFSLSPRGKHVVTVCQGTACHVRGAPFILGRIKNQLDVEPGNTTKDDQFTLETVNCLGACALAPIVVVDGDYHGQATVQKTDALLIKYSSKKAKKGTRIKNKKKGAKKAKKAKPKMKKTSMRHSVTKKKQSGPKKKSVRKTKKAIKRKSVKKTTSRRSRKK